MQYEFANVKVKDRSVRYVTPKGGAMIRFSQIAAMNLHYQRYSFRYFVESVKRLGLNTYELWMGAPHFYNYYNEKNHNAINNIKQLNRDYGLEIVCVTPEQCVYPVNIASSDKELREYSIQYFRNYIEQTAELEVRRMLTSAGWGNYNEEEAATWAIATDSFGRLLRVAEKEGVEVAFEILLPYESNVVYNLETLQRMLDTFDSPNLKCALDTVPISYEGKTLDEYFQHFKEQISHIHLIDGKPDGHLSWGDGEQPLDQHLATLDRYGYEGAITIEIADQQYWNDPEKALAQSLAAIRQYVEE